MKKFLDENFLLNTPTAVKLYHDFAAKMPILDYHNHLSPAEIALDRKFENISQAWLAGDHYKWRAMRANGINEHFITGSAGDYEKFEKWAETVPHTIGNPLFHWTHLELKNVFGITELLTPATAKSIYENASKQLSQNLSTKTILELFKVRTLCTTDDPADALEFHDQVSKQNGSFRMLPTFRPDKAMAIENTQAFNEYVGTLERITGLDINTWEKFCQAIKLRHDFFNTAGCRLSDHGMETFYSDDYLESEIRTIFLSARSGKTVQVSEILKFKSACLFEFAKLDAAGKWTQQFHVGAIRNNNSRLMKSLGSDGGADSIGDFSLARPMSRFFDKLDREGLLPKTIVYNLNPAWNEVVATMIANFNIGSTFGKMQFGAAWWFMDQKDGIERQLQALGNMGLLSRFVGMLTDSRSFLSFPRHEYFRRILCNRIGGDVENGELPNDQQWLGQIVDDICYNNAVRYFQF